MKNKDSKIRILIIVIIIVLLAIIFLFTKKVNAPVVENNNIIIKQENKNIEILGNKLDLVSFSIIPGSKVSGVMSYRGSVKGGYFFEANILINILDMNKKVLKTSNAVATSNWMTAEPVLFEGNIDFTRLTKGPAYFEIHNDNASGLPENDKSILIPIIIK